MTYDNGITPKEARRELRRWYPVAVIAAVMLVSLGIVVAVLGSKAEFWVSTQSAKNNANIANINTQTQHNGIGFQSGQVGVLQEQIANIDTATVNMDTVTGMAYADLHAQRLADARLGCTAASQLTSIPADEQGWVAQNCADGVLSPTSPLYK